jgi:cob(I)alamin adenosyltransferase
MTIYLYTGNGAGKTTNALGIIIRELGHERNVLMIQFLKWKKDTGEMLFSQFWQNVVVDNPYNGVTGEFECYQFGREGWIGLNNLEYKDKQLSIRGLNFTYDKLTNKHFDLLILDEINMAVNYGLISIDEFKEFLKVLPYNIDIVMTGRGAPQSLIDIADIVNEIREIKAPKEFIYKKGVQY